jgi:hypothetical protein
LTKANRFNPSCAAEDSNNSKAGICRHNCHVVNQGDVGLGGCIVEDHPRQGTIGGQVTLVIAILFFCSDRLVENHTQVGSYIMTERRCKLETEQDANGKMNLHGCKSNALKYTITE